MYSPAVKRRRHRQPPQSPSPRTPRSPCTAPLHPAKVDPVAATCVNVTAVPLAKLAAPRRPAINSRPARSSPSRFPFPPSSLSTRMYLPPVNVAVTASRRSHRHHASPGPRTCPAPSRKSRSRRRNLRQRHRRAHSQNWPRTPSRQLIPVGALVTVPVPVPAFAHRQREIRRRPNRRR